jgi:hypothetical protein
MVKENGGHGTMADTRNSQLTADDWVGKSNVIVTAARCSASANGLSLSRSAATVCPGNVTGNRSLGRRQADAWSVLGAWALYHVLLQQIA